MRRPAATILRACASSAGLALFLGGPPIALAYLLPSPLPRSWPTGRRALDWLNQPNLITVDGLITVGTGVLWLLWAALVLLVLAELTATLTRLRLPRIPLPSPLRGLIAGLAATVSVAINSEAVHAASAATVASAERPAMPQHGAVLPPAIPHPRGEQAPVVGRAERRERLPEWATNAPGGVHHVVRGDNLWNIAAGKLGNPQRWREIYALNKSQRQANGYALTDPDELHIGWFLVLPPRQHPAAPPPAAKPPETGAPAPRQIPEHPDATPPSTPGAPASVAPHQEQESPTTAHHSGVTLPSQAWISLGLSAAIAAAAALLRLRHRRRARLSTNPIPLNPQPGLSPVPPSLKAAETAGTRLLTLDTSQGMLSGVLPTAPHPPIPVALTGHGDELSLLAVPGPAIALTGPGAASAARAIIASALATGVLEHTAARPLVVTPAATLGRLLPPDVPVTGLDPHHETFDGERLIIPTDTVNAITHAEEEMIHRRRVLETLGAPTVDELNSRDDHIEQLPPYVLLIEPDQRYAARIQAIAAHRHALQLHIVALGTVQGVPSYQVTTDGTVTKPQRVELAEEHAGKPSRLATLTASDLVDLLTLLAQIAARPEPDLGDEQTPTADRTTADAGDPGDSSEPIPTPTTEKPPPVRLSVLGPITLATANGPITTGVRSGSYAALALLAAYPAGRTLAQLADNLYPEVDPSAAVKRVRTDVNAARTVLRTATGHQAKAAFVTYHPNTSQYRIDPDLIEVDLWQMLTAIQQANHAATDDQAIAHLRRAAQLYRGDFATGHDLAWISDYATTYRHQILNTYARIAEILEPGHPDQAIAALETALQHDPINEELYQRIIRIHGHQQRPDAVRRTLRLLDDRLAELAGAEVSEATRRIAHRQLQHPT